MFVLAITQNKTKLSICGYILNSMADILATVSKLIEIMTRIIFHQSMFSFQTFAFDHCFWSMDPNEENKFSNQEHVFQSLGAELLDNAFAGYNACIFAYGQTGRHTKLYYTCSNYAALRKVCLTYEIQVQRHKFSRERYVKPKSVLNIILRKLFLTPVAVLLSSVPL